MRGATIILFVLIMGSIILGLAYNTMSPYFEKLGLKDPESDVELAPDGGIFISKDGGRSWAQAGIALEESLTEKQFPQIAAFQTADVFAVAFNPKNENQAYIGTSSGLYSYDQASNAITPISNINGSIFSIAIDPTNSDRIYIAIKSGFGSKIQKAVRAHNFYEVYSTLKNSDKIIGIWVDSYNPNAVYAGTETGLFLESGDFGESWSIKREFDSPLRFLKMSPNDTRIMYAITGNSTLLKSFNSGATWQDISSSFSKQKGDPGFTIKNIEINSSNISELYAATNKGLFRSTNAGSAFSKVELIVSEKDPDVAYIALDPLDSNILYMGIGSQIHKTSDRGKNWQIKTLGTSRHINIIKLSPSNPNRIVIGVLTITPGVFTK